MLERRARRLHRGGGRGVGSASRKTFSPRRTRRPRRIRKSMIINFVLLCLRVFAACANFRWPVVIQNGICSRQDAKHAKSGSLISLRPLQRRSGHALQLCARYSEFWLRLLPRYAFAVNTSSQETRNNPKDREVSLTRPLSSRRPRGIIVTLHNRFVRFALILVSNAGGFWKLSWAERVARLYKSCG